MFKKLFSFLESVKKEPEKITSQELSQSVPYEDEALKSGDKANLFIKPDGTPVLVDRLTGEIPSEWIGYEVSPMAVQELKEKLGSIKKEFPKKVSNPPSTIDVEKKTPILS
jgi:hypothetical protein